MIKCYRLTWRLNRGPSNCERSTLPLDLCTYSLTELYCNKLGIFIKFEGLSKGLKYVSLQSTDTETKLCLSNQICFLFHFHFHSFIVIFIIIHTVTLIILLSQKLSFETSTPLCSVRMKFVKISFCKL